MNFCRFIVSLLSHIQRQTSSNKTANVYICIMPKCQRRCEVKCKPVKAYVCPWLCTCKCMVIVHGHKDDIRMWKYVCGNLYAEHVCTKLNIVYTRGYANYTSEGLCECQWQGTPMNIPEYTNFE